MSTIANTLADSRTGRLKALVRVENSLKLSEQVALALDTLRKNLLRSALTILGIVIGITTVIAVSSVINGLNDNVLGGIRDLGSDTIIAYRFPWASLSRPPSEWFTRKELLPEFADDMANLPHVKAASPSMRIFQPQFGVGTSDVRHGSNRAKNVILQGISGGSNPEDNIALMPVTTLRKLYPNKRDYVIFAKASDPKYVTEAVEEIRDLLRRKRRLSNEKPDDFALFTSDYFLDLWNKISSLIFILMFAVASVGLLVGGIGVMNIMLVSVTERTREIGVRKAIGAKRSNILMQFLIEAVTLSALGGIIGVILGAGLTALLKYAVHMPAELSGFWVFTALILCALIR